MNISHAIQEIEAQRIESLKELLLTSLDSFDRSYKHDIKRLVDVIGSIDIVCIKRIKKVMNVKESITVIGLKKILTDWNLFSKAFTFDDLLNYIENEIEYSEPTDNVFDVCIWNLLSNKFHHIIIAILSQLISLENHHPLYIVLGNIDYRLDIKYAFQIIAIIKEVNINLSICSCMTPDYCGRNHFEYEYDLDEYLIPSFNMICRLVDNTEMIDDETLMDYAIRLNTVTAINILTDLNIVHRNQPDITTLTF